MPVVLALGADDIGIQSAPVYVATDIYNGASDVGTQLAERPIRVRIKAYHVVFCIAVRKGEGAVLDRDRYVFRRARPLVALRYHSPSGIGAIEGACQRRRRRSEKNNPAYHRKHPAMFRHDCVLIRSPLGVCLPPSRCGAKGRSPFASTVAVVTAAPRACSDYPPNLFVHFSAAS